jgi:hypothetical protein
MLKDPGEGHLTRRSYYLMSAARFRFYADLNDFLPVENRGKVLTRCFSVSGSVKDFVEGFGVPHTEVDLVLANGKPVAFSCPPRDGDLVSVYHIFESLDIALVSRVRPAPLRVRRFLLDVHVGRLAAYLRMAGFDALFVPSLSRIFHESLGRSDRRPRPAHLAGARSIPGMRSARSGFPISSSIA